MNNRLEKFESWTEIPMLILVIILMVILVAPFMFPLPNPTIQLFEMIDWAIWAVFVVEFTIRIYLSEKKLTYIKKHWIDVLVVLLPLLRIFRVVRIFRLLRIFTLFGKFTSEAKIVLTRYRFHYLLVLLLFFIVIGAALIYQFDKDLPGGNESLMDAFWIAVVNTISGGFANIYPAGFESRGVSIVLILFGTVLVSYFTAMLASYFSEQEQEKDEERIERKLDSLIEEVKQIKNRLK